MELIAKISKGSKMDQIYIPKKRNYFSTGSYVIIKPLEIEIKKTTQKPYFYNIKEIEPIKLFIIKEIIKIINQKIKLDNIIMTGSFLDKGFDFKDIDILLINKNKLNIKEIKKDIERTIGIKAHLILLDNKTLIKGLSIDPLYQMMLSKYVSKKRLIYRIKHKINYKILDLHLLKSKSLIDNFDVLNGNEKYYLIRNLVAIFLYLKNKKINKEKVDKTIKEIFKKEIREIKENLLEKNKFLKRYNQIYNQTFNKIMQGIKNASK